MLTRRAKGRRVERRLFHGRYRQKQHRRSGTNTHKAATFQHACGVHTAAIRLLLARLPARAAIGVACDNAAIVRHGKCKPSGQGQEGYRKRDQSDKNRPNGAHAQSRYLPQIRGSSDGIVSSELRFRCPFLALSRH
jgi:hypothetical protein